MSTVPLKYLFCAVYEDGTRFYQGADDRSRKDPTKSAYFDVDHSRLVRFELHGPPMASHDINSVPFEAAHEYAVDLKDGCFYVDGAPEYLHDPYIPLHDVELRRFLNVGQLRVMGGPNAGDSTIVLYYLGFRAKGPDGAVIECGKWIP